ncbi:MAG: hypothetical protein ACUVT7_06165 [Thermoplasmata archaeon]
MRIEEPAVDRWSDDFGSHERRQGVTTLPFFSLSGGVMRDKARIANRIDGLLTKMMQNPSSVRYLPSIDKNLDYLFTSLQLDMINAVALEVMAAEGQQAGTERNGTRLPDKIE